jgi:putative ABC transport system permease protein
MGQIIRIAVRNLWQHKTKSLILGIFICVGVAIVLCGNGFLESTQRGMERDFRANYTGDIFIEEKMEDGVVLDITGANSMGSAMGESISTPALMNIDKIDSIIKSTDGIKAETKFITSKGILSTEKVGDDFEPADDVRNEIPYFLIFSGETDSYYKMFDKMHITSGALPSDSADEVLVDNRTRDKFTKYYKLPLELGDKVLVEGMGTGNGFIIREATVCGFYDQPDVNTAMAAIAYISPRLARSFAGLTYASSYAEELPSTVDTSLSSQSEDDLFGSGDDMLSADGSDSDVLASSSTDFNNILGDTSMRDKLNQVDDGSYHFIVLKTTHSWQADKIISSLNKQFDSQGLTCKAVNWKSAASSYVKAVEGIGGIFTALVVILAIVVFIIIMNTLVVSVIERTAEIGTMRALGADKLFVRKLFFTESISISLIASIAGVILAFIAMAIVNACHFTVTGDIAKIILGGGSISLIPTVKSVVTTVLLVMLGSVLANIYPVRAALRITPLQALSQDGE